MDKASESAHWGNRARAVPPSALPLFHESSDHAGLDALGRSFNSKRWQEHQNDLSFHKALLIRQMGECLDRAPLSLRDTPELDAARAALIEYRTYSQGVHPSTHLGHKNFSGELQKQFLALERKAGASCGSKQVIEALARDNELAAGGHYPLFKVLDDLPRAIGKAQTIQTIAKAANDLHSISTIHDFHQRRAAFGRVLDVLEPLQDFINKFSDKSRGHEPSFTQKLQGDAQQVKRWSLLPDALELSAVAANAEHKYFPVQNLGEHALVKAYRSDRKGCKASGIAPYDFTTQDVLDSSTMDVVYAARWGALADRIAGELRGNGINLNKASIATKHAGPKVDDLMQLCGLPNRVLSPQR